MCCQVWTIARTVQGERTAVPEGELAVRSPFRALRLCGSPSLRAGLFFPVLIAGCPPKGFARAPAEFFCRVCDSLGRRLAAIAKPTFGCRFRGVPCPFGKVLPCVSEMVFVTHS